MAFFPNGWQHYLIGGLLIGSGVSLLFALTGLIGGMSSVYSSTWSWILRTPFFQHPRLVNSRQWRLAYAGGLILGAALWWFLLGGGARVAVELSPLRLLIGGVLVGYGSRLSRGCTSGHGICGLASLNRPSLLAVCTFMLTAIVTANLLSRVASA